MFSSTKALPDDNPRMFLVYQKAEEMARLKLAIDALLSLPEKQLEETWPVLRRYATKHSSGRDPDFYFDNIGLRLNIWLDGEGEELPISIRERLKALKEVSENERQEFFAFCKEKLSPEQYESVRREYASFKLNNDEFEEVSYSLKQSRDGIQHLVKRFLANDFGSLSVSESPQGGYRVEFTLKPHRGPAVQNTNVWTEYFEMFIDQAKLAGALTRDTHVEYFEDTPPPHPAGGHADTEPDILRMVVTSTDPAFKAIAADICRIDAEHRFRVGFEKLFSHTEGGRLRSVPIRLGPAGTTNRTSEEQFELLLPKDTSSGVNLLNALKGLIEQAGGFLNDIKIVPVSSSEYRIVVEDPQKHPEVVSLLKAQVEVEASERDHAAGRGPG